MGVEGRISQPIDIHKLFKSSQEVRNSPDLLRRELRRQLMDDLLDLRSHSDELPDHKITHDDPKSGKYKCKTNWMFKLLAKLNKAVHDGLLNESEKFIVADYTRFLIDRKNKHHAIMNDRLSLADKNELRRIAVQEGSARFIEHIKKNFWVPTTPEEITYINQTLEVLASTLGVDGATLH